MKYKIISIRKKPWWKIWITDNWEITVEYDDGKIKTIGIYTHSPGMLLEGYVKKKLLTGSQWASDIEKIEKLVGKEFEL